MKALKGISKVLKTKKDAKPKAKKKIKSLPRIKTLRSRIKQKQQIRSKYKLRRFLERAGFRMEAGKVSKLLFNICVGINLVISAYLLWFFAGRYDYDVSFILLAFALLWIVVFLGILGVIWVIFNLILDVRIFQRRVTIEEVLPDYLQLTSSNIRSGMPIDQALWLAVRPRFGVLATEIEIVAKETMSGGNLIDALKKFANRYDSLILKRSINLLIVGLESGGEIGELLDKISSNIKDSHIMRKEMSANVASYSIFITFASVAGAPFLFGLADQLLRIIQNITANIEVPQNASSGLGLSFGAGGIAPGDFQIFAVISLIITASFSASIVSTIKHGTIKKGIQSIPIYSIIAVSLFFLFSTMFSGLLSGLF